MRLKVYGWTALIREPERSKLGTAKHIIQCRCIVAAHSMAEVRRLLDQSPRSLFNLCETGNAVEIGVATAKPLTFFARGLDCYTGYFTEVPPTAVR